MTQFAVGPRLFFIHRMVFVGVREVEKIILRVKRTA